MPIQHATNPHNEAYMRAKAERMGHILHHQGMNLDEQMLHAEREQDAARRPGPALRRRARSDGPRRATRSSPRASTRTSPSA